MILPQRPGTTRSPSARGWNTADILVVDSSCCHDECRYLRLLMVRSSYLYGTLSKPHISSVFTSVFIGTYDPHAERRSRRPL